MSKTKKSYKFSFTKKKVTLIFINNVSCYILFKNKVKCNFIVLSGKSLFNFNAKIRSFFIFSTFPNEKKPPKI